MNFQSSSGQTSISEEERTGLLLPLNTLAELDREEGRNIVLALARVGLKERKPGQLIEEDFIKEFHSWMFCRVWAWAGQFRRSDKNMGLPWPQIPVAYRQLREDAAYWIEQATYSPDELALRYKHRLVSIHPFPNGNGRHSRLMADLLVESLGRERFSWGVGMKEQARPQYLQALRAADRGDFSLLLFFARQ